MESLLTKSGSDLRKKIQERLATCYLRFENFGPTDTDVALRSEITALKWVLHLLGYEAELDIVIRESKA